MSSFVHPHQPPPMLAAPQPVHQYAQKRPLSSYEGMPMQESQRPRLTLPPINFAYPPVPTNHDLAKRVRHGLNSEGIALSQNIPGDLINILRDNLAPSVITPPPIRPDLPTIPTETVQPTHSKAVNVANLIFNQIFTHGPLSSRILSGLIKIDDNTVSITCEEMVDNNILDFFSKNNLRIYHLKNGKTNITYPALIKILGPEMELNLGGTSRIWSPLSSHVKLNNRENPISIEDDISADVLHPIKMASYLANFIPPSEETNNVLVAEVSKAEDDKKLILTLISTHGPLTPPFLATFMKIGDNTVRILCVEMMQQGQLVRFKKNRCHVYDLVNGDHEIKYNLLKDQLDAKDGYSQNETAIVNFCHEEGKITTEDLQSLFPNNVKKANDLIFRMHRRKKILVRIKKGEYKLASTEKNKAI